MRVVAPLIVCLCSCANTSTIRTDRLTLEGRIVGGDRDALFVRNEAGYDATVNRAEVQDIDHPGNVHAVVGAILAASGGINLGTFAGFCRGFGNGCQPFVITAGGMIAAGAGMFIWGLWTWLTSKNAVEPPVEQRLVPPAPLPLPVVPSSNL
jgi:hypothetical protein